MSGFWDGIVGQLDLRMVLVLIAMGLLFYLLSRNSKNVAAAREADRQTWLKVGANVATASGFLGTIVDIDGDAVTLQSPGGEETVWLKAAINRPMEIPLAPASEEEKALEAEGNDTTETDAAKGQESRGQA